MMLINVAAAKIGRLFILYFWVCILYFPFEWWNSAAHSFYSKRFIRGDVVDYFIILSWSWNITTGKYFISGNVFNHLKSFYWKYSSIVSVSIWENTASKHFICRNVVDHLLNFFVIFLLQSPANGSYQCNLGTIACNRFDEFSENFQTASDPPHPPIFRNLVALFFGRPGNLQRNSFGLAWPPPFSENSSFLPP